MPSGAAGKKYIEAIIRLLKLWIQDSPLKTIALKVIIYYHLKGLQLWEEEDISNLLHEGGRN